MLISLYTVILFLVSQGEVLGLQAAVQSLCYRTERRSMEIAVGPDQFEIRTDWISIRECCPGYTEVDEYCQPLCDPFCDHGKCVDSNTCLCEENYEGPSCSTLICPPGYTGTDCKDDCPENTFGRNCEENCTCRNGACDHITGKCNCDDGWSGLDCSVACPQGVTCFNGGICKDDNSCDCPPGYIGEQCEDLCQQGYWGANCSNQCDCDNDYYFICEPTSGSCTSKCQNGEYLDSTCWCDDDWTGEFCTEKLCPFGYYGENCEKTCKCQDDTTKYCDRVTGECTCSTGWIGDTCGERCPYMTFGDKCNSTCECEYGRHEGCHESTGECTCKREWTGVTCKRKCKCVNGYCDNYGNCICDPGWQGRNCDWECDVGYYGNDCSSFCGFYANEGNIICDPFRGPGCAAGWTGGNCTKACSPDRYGRNCEKKCSCSYPKICSRFTGQCHCSPGWFGENCEKVCTVGFYGLHCKHACSCPNCRPTDGYCCQKNSHGECDQYCPEEQFDTESNVCQQKKYFTGASAMLSPMSSIVLVAGLLAICLNKCKKKEKKILSHTFRYFDTRLWNILHLAGNWLLCSFVCVLSVFD